MGETHFSGPVISYGGFYGGEVGDGSVLFVAPEGTGSGEDWNSAFTTVQSAVDVASPNATIILAPGDYEGDVVITGDKTNLTFRGAGPRGSVNIIAETVNGIAVENRADQVVFENIGFATNGTGVAFLNFGARVRAYACKLESDSTGTAARVLPGTVLQHDAEGDEYYGNGADVLFYDCEFAWGIQGLESASSDYGACTQMRVQRCRFHDLSTCHLRSNDIQASDVCTRGLLVDECVFEKAEDASAPTDFLRVDVTGDTGTFTMNRFATPTNDTALLTIAAGVMWMANATEAGWSTARPA